MKWKKRDSIEDLPRTPHQLNKTMSDLEEFVVVIELRKSLLLPLDDLLVTVRTFNMDSYFVLVQRELEN